MATQKVVICGAGFLGSNIARALVTNSAKSKVPRRVQLSSRNPARLQAALSKSLNTDQLLEPVPADVTHPSSLSHAFENADVVVSLVGVMHGSPKEFEEIQWRGAENVALAARDRGAKLIHFSAIGADPESHIPYVRTKGLAERSVLDICPDATIIRPSLVFGPEDDFFNRFARLSIILPFLPVFGGGQSLFQPVYVGDIARVVEILSRKDSEVDEKVSGKIVEAGGPEVFRYRELMELVVKHTGRWRPILSLPWWVGGLQGAVLEQLPPNLLTVTRSQVEQLKSDNIVSRDPPANHVSFKELVEAHSSGPLKSVHEILPTYLPDVSLMK